MNKTVVKNVKSISVAVLFMSLLSGCTGMNTKFGCNAVAGDSCTPVNKINQQADAGVYENTQSGTDGKTVSISNRLTAYGSRGNGGYNVIVPKPGEPIRFGESIQRIWVAPYEDTAGNYHEPSFIYTVLKKSHWIGLPAKEVNTSPEED